MRSVIAVLAFAFALSAPRLHPYERDHRYVVELN